ncbi:MAG: hypothetical protein A3E87_04390 [Gammaproteobacteria bacterium RIFCSPHIGHO2_12_FULL_35_23]|nr:MAG: hypothetical protein A3E87_04390 [Gammaproteobacteria bacterium RIFCSPHIGHO2_12_FULL_35_23]
MRHKHKSKLPQGTFIAQIHGLSHDGRGIATVNNKTTFIPYTLIGEEAEFEYTYHKSSFAEGKAIKILSPAPERLSPFCEYFTVCGGCSLQHMSHTAQMAHKQSTLLEQLKHFGNVKANTVMSPVVGLQQGYRNKARLGVRNVPKKGLPLVGFRERQKSFITEIEHCAILNPTVGKIIKPLRELISTLSIPFDIAQLEVAVGDDKTALIFRHLKPLSQADNNLLKAFSETHHLTIYLQPKGLDSIHLLGSPTECPLLSYRIPYYQLELLFHPSDFTQINMSINLQLIDLVNELLATNEQDLILDLFCGLGNFTLPMATLAKQVVGVEGNTKAVERATLNAQHNQLNNVSFYTCDLSQPLDQKPWAALPYNKLLLDPARSGALEIVQSFEKFATITHIVYVSCNPATLARDLNVLVNQQGFVLEKIGILDMFPHTSHVESIALLKR